VTKLTPQTRILAGALSFATCLIAPTATPTGALLAAGVSAGWVVACWPPLKVVRSILFFGLVLLLPYFLLAPLMPVSEPGTTWMHSAPILGAMVLQGMTGLAVSIATIATLNASDLRKGLLRLPVPSLVSAILLQIVYQSATLAYETDRVASAMAVRGASKGGRTAWRVMSSLPQVWLPRIIERADRIAATMEFRGYCTADLPSDGHIPVRLGDGVAFASALAALGAAVATRTWSSP
jgi:energy-coupling factor transporter transmembrane protein EcfT